MSSTPSGPASGGVVSFRVVSFADAFAGKWLVIREHDMRLMTEKTDPREALRWISTWGDSVGVRKNGRPLPDGVLAKIAAWNSRTNRSSGFTSARLPSC
jgi:hypothetical protein